VGLQWFDMTNNLTVSDYLNFYIPPKKDYNLSFPQNTLSIINPVKDILPKPSLYFIDERIIDELKIQEIPLPSVPCKLDALLSFALLGIDIKITPEGEVKIIEVNGIHSGMGSLASKEMAENEKKMEQHLFSLGKEQLGYIAARYYFHNKVFPERLVDEHALQSRIFLCDNYGLQVVPSECELKRKFPEWEMRYGKIASTFIAMEDMLEDKLRCDSLFEDCREIKAKTYSLNLTELTRLHAEKPKYVVLKPRYESQGRGVRILEVSPQFGPPFVNDNYYEETLYHEYRYLKSLTQFDGMERHGEMVLESFVPSKPILSSETGKFHDGCMRYVVFVEEDLSGKINFSHFGGIWRLCPEPLPENAKRTINNSRANFCQDALAEKVSPEDIAAVKTMIENKLPLFYKRLARRARGK